MYLNAINHYKPGSGANDPVVMDEIRQEHVRIMDEKLQETIAINGKNSVQQVKTIIVEPLTEVVELNVSTVVEGYPGAARRSSIVNTSGMALHPSGRVSTLSIAPSINKRASQVQGILRLM